MTKSYGRIYKNKKNIYIDDRDLYNVWPVGSIYISVVNINPSEYFGGTWQVFGTGRCLVGIDTSQTEFNTIEKTGGEKTHKLTVSEMPKHKHTAWTAQGGSWARETVSCGNKTAHNEADYGSIDYAGGDNAHNNLQPYITVYMWKRIA